MVGFSQMSFLNAAFKSTYFYNHSRERLHLYNYKRQKYAGKPIQKGQAASDYLVSLLQQDKPFFVTRIGGTECEVMRQTLLIRHHLKKHYTDQILDWSKRLSGIFPNTPEYLGKFTDIYLDAIKNVTAFGIWFRPMEEYIIQKFSHYDAIIDFYALYPGINDWTKALKGKKVLVVSPFTETIQSQYQKRKLIFPQNPELLPEFSLITYKSFVSFAGQDVPFSTWDQALNQMFSEIQKLDFDVCLLGCGAYGLPLGSMIYEKMGKQVIHVGGSLQLLFGIDGNLYHNYNLTKHLMNSAWVYPSDKETPKGASGVENSIYWKPSYKK
jgi:hypothetical protein